MKKVYNFCATVAVKRYVYVDDMMTPVDPEDMAYASTFDICFWNMGTITLRRFSTCCRNG
eukprot:14660827-Heterocapsa_arctica.AAC.1